MSRHLFTAILCVIFLPYLCKAHPSNEKYFILYVEGIITNLTQNKKLKAGDYILSSDQLRFQDKKSRALVMSSSKGRFMLRPGKENTVKEGELITLVNKLLLPIKKNRELSTREVASAFIGVDDLQKYFGNTQFFIIGDSLSFLVNATYYPLDASSFLALSYVYKDQKISKRLPFQKNKVLFPKEAIFRTKNGFSIKPEDVDSIKLYQVNIPDKFLITTFKLSYIPEYKLERLIEHLLQLNQESIPKDPEARRTYLLDFCVESLGNTDVEIFMSWLEQKGY